MGDSQGDVSWLLPRHTEQYVLCLLGVHAEQGPAGSWGQGAKAFCCLSVAWYLFSKPETVVVLPCYVQLLSDPM